MKTGSPPPSWGKGDTGAIRNDDVFSAIEELIAAREAALDPRSHELLDSWPDTITAYSGDEYVVNVRGREIRTRLNSVSLSGTKVPKVALPRFEDPGEILRWQLAENLPGSFPFTPATGIPSAPTGASICFPGKCPRSGFPRRSIR